MKKIFVIVSLLTVIFSCEKPTEFCNSEECQKYYSIWKELFISRNNLTAGYFDEHIFPYLTETTSWNDGKSFRVEYIVRIDWAEARLADQFIIWIDPSTAGLYPSVPTPRSTYLSKDQINKLLDLFAFSSSLYKVEGIDHLKYSTREEAVKVLEAASGINNFDGWEVYFKSPGFMEYPGHPFLRVSATIDKSKNECLSGNINLVTGETVIRNRPCAIN